MPPHRWKKGESGNPNGRPKDPDALADCIRAELDKIAEPEARKLVGEKGKKTYREILAKVAVKKAVYGDANDRKLIFNYVLGRPPETINLIQHDREITFRIIEENGNTNKAHKKTNGSTKDPQ
jgi:hypothetical protein